MSRVKSKNGPGTGKRSDSKVTGVKKKYNYTNDKGAKASANRLTNK